MRAALADLKVLHETGLLDDASYVTAQQKWVARLAAGEVQDDDEGTRGGEKSADKPMALVESGSAALAAALPTVPSHDERDVHRRRRTEKKDKKDKRKAAARAAARPEPEPEPEPRLPLGHGTPLEPLCAVLPQLDRIAFTLALRAASLHLAKRDIEIDRRALSAEMSRCGLPGKGKPLSACGFLLKESGKGGGRKPAVLFEHLGPLGFTEMHIDCLVATLEWVKNGLPPGIGDPLVEGWPKETAAVEGDHEPPPPPPHSPSASEDEDEDEDGDEDEVDADEGSDGDGSGSMVVVHREDIPAAVAAATLPFTQRQGPRTTVPRRQPQPLSAMLEAEDWDDSRSLARGRYAHFHAAARTLHLHTFCGLLGCVRLLQKCAYDCKSAAQTARRAVWRSDRLRRAVEIWLSDAGIGGNTKSSSLRGFDTGPLLEFADRENLLGNAQPRTHLSRKKDDLIHLHQGFS